MELQKQNLRKWAGRKGPKVLPEGWLPLFDAFERLGQANFKNEWTGNEHPARSALISSSALEERLRAKWDIAEILPGTTPQTESSKGQPIAFPARHPELVANVAEHADRRRFEATWGLLASLLHSGDIKAKSLGRKSALSREMWVDEDADDILCSGKVNNRWVLANEADVKRAAKKARSKSPRGVGSFSAPKLRKWYEDWVADWLKSDPRPPPPSRTDDLEAARSAFGDTLPRDPVRDLRSRIAPPSWHKPAKKS